MPISGLWADDDSDISNRAYLLSEHGINLEFCDGLNRFFDRLDTKDALGLDVLLIDPDMGVPGDLEGFTDRSTVHGFYSGMRAAEIIRRVYKGPSIKVSSDIPIIICTKNKLYDKLHAPFCRKYVNCGAINYLEYTTYQFAQKIFEFISICQFTGNK